MTFIRKSSAVLSLFAVATLFLTSLPVSSFAKTKRLPYQDPSLSVHDRARDLLKRMTIEEKAAQMMAVWMTKPNDRSTRPNDPLPAMGKFSPSAAQKTMPHGIGHFARQRELLNPRESVEYANAAQKWLTENTRLKIPAIFHDEILHGNMASGSTVFPVPVALASSWDLDLIEEVFRIGAFHTRLRGTHHVLGPNLDIAREARWGRTEETYGEDPYLAGRIAVRIVNTLQGGASADDEKIGPNNVIATGKHYVGHGQPEGGTNIAPVNISERILRETHMVPFEMAIKEANLMSIMPAYHEIDGIPVHSSKWLMDKVLRKEWGFNGVVVSDYYAMGQLQTLHFVAKDKSEASRLSIEAGVDIELPDQDVNKTIPELVKSGRLDEKLVDKAVYRILRTKFQMGLFENPYADPERAMKLTNTAADKAVALKAAQRSITLLKNENNTLPLDADKIKSIAVIGPNAEKAHLGGYTDPGHPKAVSILEGIQNKLRGKVKVNYAKGVYITKEDGNWFADTATLSDEATDRKMIAEAVEVAKKSDVVLLSIGGNEDTNKEGWADNHLGDRDSLELVGRQNDLVKAVLATGKPTVVFLTNSGPLAINYVAENVPAILEGFYIGQETGNAVADVVFGDVNPGGKLPVSFPRTAGALPIFYNRKPTSKRGYLFSTTKPLYAFGHGLSYTSFEFSNIRLAKPKIKDDESTMMMVDVKNTGKVKGDEVVQMYIRDKVSSVTRPLLELKGFQRITLNPGESKTVSIEITPEKLRFYNREMKRVVEPGMFDIMVGNSSDSLKSIPLEVIE